MPQTASVHIQYMKSLARDFIWLGSTVFILADRNHEHQFFFTLPWDTISQKSGIP